MIMKTCPKCKTTGIPDDAKFCPNCGLQLTSGAWEIVDVSLYPSIFKSVNIYNKQYVLQNDTDETLSCSINNNTYQLLPLESKVFDVSYPTSLMIVYRFTTKSIMLRTTDKFNRIIVYNIGQSLQYRTN